MNCDSIQLFAMGKNIPMRQAISEINTRVSLPSNAIRWWFPKWKREVCDPMTGLIQYLEKGRRDISRSAESAWQEATSHLGMLGGTDINSLDRMLGAFVSGVTRTGLRTSMNPWTLNIGRCKQSWFAALPFCDVFNRPRSLMLFDRKGEGHHVNLPLFETSEGMGRIRDDGLCFLDQLQREEEVVFAVGDPKVALQLKTQHAFSYTKPLPLVGYLPDTGRSSWNQVRARTVIFWEPSLNVDVFRQARMVDNAKVATSPNYTDWERSSMLEQLVGFHIDVWMRACVESAVPWHEGIVDWLLNLPEDQAINAVETLDITDSEAELILEGLEGQRAARITDLFGVTRQARTVIVDGRQISQAEGKWNEMSRLGAKLILDGTIYLDRVQHPMSSGEETVVGYISRAGAVIPFHDKLSEVQVNTPGWLTRTLLNEKQSIPQISPVWARRLFRIAQAFHNPPTVQCVDRVGYVEDVGMIFPEFTVKDGKFLSNTSEVAMSNVAIPGQGLQCPEFPVSVHSSAFDTDPVSVAAWTLLSFMLSNMEAQRFGAETKGILVYAPDADDASYLATMQLAEKLALPIYQYTSDTDLCAMDRGHVLPLVVDARHLPPDHISLSQYLFDPSPKSLLLLVSDMTPWKEVSLGGWLGMAGQRSAISSFPFKSAPDMLFSGLEWLHKTMNSRATMLSLEMLQSGVTENIKASRHVPADTLATLAARVQRGSIGDVGWSSIEVDRVLIPFFHLYNLKGLSVGEATGVMTIQAGPLLAQFRKLTGVHVKMEQITYSLRRAGILRGLPGNNVEIDVSDWNAMLDRYRRLMPPEGTCI